MPSAWGSITTMSTTEEHGEHSGGRIEPQGHRGTKGDAFGMGENTADTFGKGSVSTAVGD